ncbi:Phospholipase/Carboxylesterase-domain-containing protein [Melampsora americana]|nr:Phospholipase/Carboxylesterase-domain-containing protein [Melampsora americana]
MKSWKRLRLMNWQIKRDLHLHSYFIILTFFNLIFFFILGLHFGIDLIQSDSFFLKFSKLNEFKIQSNGSLLTQAPQPEHLDPKLYRTSWSSLEREISPIEFDVIEPIDDQNGKGIGWTIVFIHGLGSQNSSHGYQWREYLLSTMYKPTDSKLIGNLTGLKFILPKASIIPITVYSDLQSKEDERPGWFDIKDWRDLNFLEDEKSLRESCIQISSILLNQIRQSKIEMKKTIIAGFSQGAVMALLTTLALFEPPAATLMLSGYLPLPFRLPLLSSTQPEFYKSTSLYWIHGTEDNVLNYNSGKSGFNLLNRILPSGFNQSKFKTISALDHGFSVDQRLIVLNWIERIVTNQSNGEFDQSLDNLIQLENPIDDPRY